MSAGKQSADYQQKAIADLCDKQHDLAADKEDE